MKLTKNTIELIITGVLVIVLIAYLGTNLRRRGRRLPSKPGPPTKEVLYPEEEGALTPPAKAPLDSFLKRAAVAKEREREWGRDPFILGSKKMGAKVGFPLDLRVTGIIFDKDRPEATYAIINGVVVRIGDEIAEAGVIDIQKGSVTLRRGSEEFTLRLWEAE